MQTYYTGIVALSAVAMLFMIQGIRGNVFLPKETVRHFQTLFGVLIVANCAEWLAAMLNGGGAQWRWLHVAAKFLEMILAPLIPFVCAVAIGKGKLYRAMWIPVAANVILQVLSLLFGWVFTVDDANMYHRGGLYILYCGLFASEGIMLFIHCRRFSRIYQNTNALFLININLLVLAAMLLPLMLPSLRLDWSCVSASAILFYVYYDQLVQQTDGLTQLLSRRSLDVAISRLDKTATLYFFDVDGFKRINDVYGHAYGDECLEKVGEALRSSFENVGACYRYGGDEFCVITHKPLTNPNKPVEMLRGRLELIRETDENFPTVSAGFTQFNPKTETAEKALHRADTRMYTDKRKSDIG